MQRFFRGILFGIAGLILLAAVLGAVLSAISATVSVPPSSDDSFSEPIAPRLDLTDFRPGFLISDEVFYNYQAMDLPKIEAFIREKNAGCQDGAAPCLANYRESTKDMPATQRCSGYAGNPEESAAMIIFKTSQACHLNPQVLLVLLQKEQGLLTASGFDLTPARYEIATGFGCPDEQNCDERFFGFSTQVYYAAAQFQRYRQQPHLFKIRAGQMTRIAFSPDPNCGDAEVFVENQATAGLYNYTPYQPDAGVLVGNPGHCSSFGNANFYGLFRAWFGDSHR
ncbi:hemagglutinin [Mobiluncus mulieris]|uniref:Hemagglutinin n=1 Tax=Mobiluncus mulieris TaxID=2052 RepID=A0A7Y0YH62_9ACTO|nr:hemagglutinin [Mobiluncus mulieris]NMW91038.1 hemagglutinin [Mobiluncus mulieris]NMX02667.1 hemagglutinin [Mobiluncus mulieris]NMX10789.1 hemagglutinin [Mobiluncus mulieris]